MPNYLHFADGVLVMILGVITLIAGVLLTTIPWLNYCILKVSIVATKIYLINFISPLGTCN